MALWSPPSTLRHCSKEQVVFQCRRRTVAWRPRKGTIGKHGFQFREQRGRCRQEVKDGGAGVGRQGEAGMGVGACQPFLPGFWTGRGREEPEKRKDSPVAVSPSSTHGPEATWNTPSSLPPTVARLYLLTSLISVATELSCFSLWGWLWGTQPALPGSC